MAFFDPGVITQTFGFEAIRFDEFLKTLPPPEQRTDEYTYRLCSLKDEWETRERNNGIAYYQPQDYQMPFHRSQKRERLVLGGNQTGKTEQTVAEGIMLSLGIHPYRKMRTPNKGRVIAVDLQRGIGEVIQTKYEKLLPMDKVHKIRRYSSGEFKKIIYKNGSTVEFLSYESDPKIFEGWVGDWVHADEPIPRDIYIACQRGLMRYNGIFFMAMTPLSEAWIYDELYLKADPDNPNAPDVFEYDLSQNKYLSEKAKLDFISKLDPDEIEARVHGKFRHLSGRIFKKFDIVAHCIPSFELPKHWTRYMAMDYHPRKDCTMIWCAVDPRGIVYFYDELAIDKTIAEISRAIRAKELYQGEDNRHYKDNIFTRWIDPISATPDRTNGAGCAQREFAIKPNNLIFRSATKKWELGKNAINEYLRPGRDKKPGVYFFRDKVPETIKSMLRYSWDEWKDKNKDKKEAPKKDKFSDWVDPVRYILVTKPNYVEMKDRYHNRPPENTDSLTGYSYGQGRS